MSTSSAPLALSSSALTSLFGDFCSIEQADRWMTIGHLLSRRRRGSVDLHRDAGYYRPLPQASYVRLGWALSSLGSGVEIASVSEKPLSCSRLCRRAIISSISGGSSSCVGSESNPSFDSGTDLGCISSWPIGSPLRVAWLPQPDAFSWIPNPRAAAVRPPVLPFLRGSFCSRTAPKERRRCSSCRRRRS